MEHPAHSALTEADTHTIRVDVMRTRGNHPAFGPQMRERLRELLTQLCLKEKIRYMQGLHEVRKTCVRMRFVALVPFR